MLVLRQGAIAGGPVALLLVIRAALTGMDRAGVHAPLGQPLSTVLALASHGSPIALNVAAVSARSRALLVLQSVLATLDVAHRALLHLLRVMARVVHVLVAELAFHDSLLAG